VKRALFGLAVALAACSDFKGAETDGGSSDAALADVSAPEAGSGDATSADGPSTPHDGGGAGDSGGTDAPVTGDGGSTGGCDGSACPIEVVVAGLNQVTLVVLDANNVYFGDEGSTTGVVYQCPKSGCTTPVTLGPGFATGLGVDGTNVYWNDFVGGAIVSCAIGGCANAPTTIAPTQPSAEGVTFDGTNLYWASNGNIVTCVPPACAIRATLATGESTAIVHLASEKGDAYWVNSGSLEKCAAAGCGGVPFKLIGASGASVFVKNGVMYFTSGNAVVSCPVTGCATPHTIGASNDPYGIGADGVEVYWLDDIDQVVYRCPVSGCNAGPERFATGQLSQPGANVALDGEYAYWTLPDQVLRKHK
jgi:hypothetical protein